MFAKEMYWGFAKLAKIYFSHLKSFKDCSKEWFASVKFELSRHLKSSGLARNKTEL